MKAVQVDIVSAPTIRQSLTTPGDIRSDIEFQNDVNRLLARFEESSSPWRPLAQMVSFGVGPKPRDYVRRNSVMKPFRVFDGGSANLPAAAVPYSLARSSPTGSEPVSQSVVIHAQFRRGA
ncbi:MAG TPA: hypothetical protein VFH73_20940 [Polyangia bacterium]|jgi:hypothetical protein|nr:hypothetical protein [Polyangia bacterium]